MITPLVQSADPRAVSPATVPCQSSIRRRAAHSVTVSVGWRGLIRLPAAPAAGTNKISLPPSASRAAKKPAARLHQSGEESGARITGQNGRGSAEQAVP